MFFPDFLQTCYSSYFILWTYILLLFGKWPKIHILDWNLAQIVSPKVALKSKNFNKGNDTISYLVCSCVFDVSPIKIVVKPTKLKGLTH